MSEENVSLRGSPAALCLPEAFAFRKQGKNIENENILPTCPTNSQKCCLASSASPLPISPPSVSQWASRHSWQTLSQPAPPRGSSANQKLQPASACSIQPASFPCGNSCWPQNRRSVWASQLLSCGQRRGRGGVTAACHPLEKNLKNVLLWIDPSLCFNPFVLFCGFCSHDKSLLYWVLLNR